MIPRPRPIPQQPAPPLPGNERMAASSPFFEQLQGLMDRYQQIPEFLREDVLEGLLVGGGIALPVAMMPNQDAEERAAAILGGIGAATFGGAAARTIGAQIGRRLPGGTKALEPGSFKYNTARMMGRKDMVGDFVADISGMAPPPRLTNEDFGRAAGRMVGDEVFGIGGTIGALALAQQMDSTPDETPGPTIGEVTLATVPGAVLGLAGSGLLGGTVDLVGINRAMTTAPDEVPDLSKYVAFMRQGKKGAV